MDAAMIVFGLVPFLVIVGLTLLLSKPRRYRGLGYIEADYEAQAHIEESDIEQMIEARNDIRRRRGKPLIGDDLVAQLRHELDQGRSPEG